MEYSCVLDVWEMLNVSRLRVFMNSNPWKRIFNPVWWLVYTNQNLSLTQEALTVQVWWLRLREPRGFFLVLRPCKCLNFLLKSSTNPEDNYCSQNAGFLVCLFFKWALSSTESFSQDLVHFHHMKSSVCFQCWTLFYFNMPTHRYSLLYESQWTILITLGQRWFFYIRYQADFSVLVIQSCLCCIEQCDNDKNFLKQVLCPTSNHSSKSAQQIMQSVIFLSSKLPFSQILEDLKPW